MIDLKNINQVKALQSNLRVAFDNPAGKEVLRFLDEACGNISTFEILPSEAVLIKEGRRQVVATLRTLLTCTPEQIVALEKRKD